MRIKPTAVTPMPQYTLLIQFSNDEKRLFDVKPYIAGSWYGKLANEAYFKTVRVAGNTVEWADGQDIAPHELYELSTPRDGFSLLRFTGRPGFTKSGKLIMDGGPEFGAQFGGFLLTIGALAK